MRKGPGPLRVLHRHIGVDRALKDLIRPHLEPYFGLCFERLCREHPNCASVELWVGTRKVYRHMRDAAD